MSANILYIGFAFMFLGGFGIHVFFPSSDWLAGSLMAGGIVLFIISLAVAVKE